MLSMNESGHKIKIHDTRFRMNGIKDEIPGMLDFIPAGMVKPLLIEY